MIREREAKSNKRAENGERPTRAETTENGTTHTKQNKRETQRDNKSLLKIKHFANKSRCTCMRFLSLKFDVAEVTAAHAAIDKRVCCWMLRR
jgi:hypothetical protein